MELNQSDSALFLTIKDSHQSLYKWLNETTTDITVAEYNAIRTKIISWNTALASTDPFYLTKPNNELEEVDGIDSVPVPPSK